MTRWRALMAVGLACFLVHLGLILHHTYFTASARNTRAFPSAPEGAAAEPERWHNFLDLNRWDSGHYEIIVREGYRSADPDVASLEVQWYPGYPLLAWTIQRSTGWKVSFVFSLLSVIFTLGFWLLLWSPTLVSAFGARSLAVASLMIATWPGGFYWFAGMTEPLVALLLVLLLVLWLRGRFGWVVLVLGYATAVKQVFVPIALVLLVLEYVRSRPRPLVLAVEGFVALSGFLAFGLYTWLAFGGFFLSSEVGAAFFAKSLDPRSLFDLTHYARYFGTPPGLTATVSVFFLWWMAVRQSRAGSEWRAFVGSLRAPQPVPVDLLVWCLAAAYTSFCVLGSAYGKYPFASFIRYQTVNVPIFLLLGLLSRDASWGRSMALYLPVAWIFLDRQTLHTVRYWMWKWVD